MSSINKITSGVMSASAKALGKVSEMKPLKWLGNEFQKDPEKALAYTTIASIIAKDGIGCYKYVYQSMNNKDIPKERRSFVSAVDLSNGVLMILAQIGMFAAMRKYSEPMFDRLFAKSFSPEAVKNITTKIRILQNKLGMSSSKKLKVEKDYMDVRKTALDSFKFVSEMAAATIIGKRVIVPFIATPVANAIKPELEKVMPKLEGDEDSTGTAEAPKIAENKVEKEDDDD